MPPFLRELTFQRERNTAEPEAFVFERQRYMRFEGDRAVEGAEFPWDRELLDLLVRLRRSSTDAEARHHVGATLRGFLKAVAWAAPRRAVRVRRRG